MTALPTSIGQMKPATGSCRGQVVTYPQEEQYYDHLPQNTFCSLLLDLELGVSL